MRIARHRRSRLHRVALRPAAARPAPGDWPSPESRRRARQAHLRRATCANLAPVADDPTATRSCRATSATRSCVERAGRPRPTRSCTSPPSRTSTGRSRPRADFVRPTCSAPRRCSTRPPAPSRAGSCTCPPTRCTARSTTGSWDRGASRCCRTRRTRRPRRRRDLLARAYAPHPRACRCAITRCSNNYGPVPVPGEGHPAVRHQPDRRRRRCRCTATGSTSGTGCTSTTTAAASHLVLTGGRPGEVYNIGGGTELTNTELTDLLLEATGAGLGRASSAVTDRLRPRPALLASTSPRSAASSATRRRCRSTRAWPTRSSGTATTATGGSRSRRGSPAS